MEKKNIREKIFKRESIENISKERKEKMLTFCKILP